MLHFLSHVRVGQEHLEMGDYGEIDKGLSSLTFGITMGFHTVWTSVVFAVRSNEATAGVHTAVIEFWLEP